jgi:hypothetical protein
MLGYFNKKQDPQLSHLGRATWLWLRTAGASRTSMCPSVAAKAHLADMAGGGRAQLPQKTIIYSLLAPCALSLMEKGHHKALLLSV